MIDTLDQNLCTRCGICLDVCPNDVFRRASKTGPYVIAHRDDCQTCFNCEIECPTEALSVGPICKPRVQVW